MPDKSFDVLININSRAEGIATAQAQIAEMKASLAETNVMADQGSASFEKQAVIQGEINAIIGTRGELLRAILTGNEAAAGAARDELSVHQQTLLTLRSETLSHEAIVTLLRDEAVLLDLAAKKNQEVAGFSLLAGANLNKAKGEATVLAREIATGSFNARTLGAFLGSLGTTFTVAAIGGFALYDLIKHMVDEAQKLDQETAKESDNLFKQIDQWRQLAVEAGSFADEVKLAVDIDKALDPLAAKLETFRQNELSKWQKFKDAFAVVGLAQIYPTGSQESEQQAQVVQKALQSAEQELEVAKESKEAWDAIQLSPVADAVDTVTKKLEQLRTEAEHLHAQSMLPADSTPGQIAAALAAFDTYIKKIQEYETWLKRLKDLEKEREQQNDQSARDAKREQQEELNAALRQQSELLEGIRQKQQLLAADPYLSAQAKQVLTLESMRNEYQALQEAITADRGRLQGGTLDPQTYERVNQEMKRLEFESDLLRQKMKALTFGGELQADITKWVNGWGTASHQIAGTIQSTIGASLQQLNQYIVTGKFNVQDLEKQFILLGLQLIEQLAIQKIASLLFTSTTTTASTAAAGIVSKAWAAPATMVSVATEGEADIVGQGALLAAISYVQGVAIGGGFSGGGYTGNKDRRQITGVVHGNEYVFTADETEALGVPFLRGLAAAAGGRAITGGPTGILTPAPGIHPLPAVDPFSPGSSMQDKFGRGPAIAGYSGGGHVGYGIHGYGYGGDYRWAVYGNWIYDNQTGEWSYWAGGGPPGGPSAGPEWQEPGILPGNENNPEHWDPRFQSPVVIGAQGGPEVDLQPQWGGGATSDYWAASETWGQYGVGWAYDAQGDPQPMSYFQQTGTMPGGPGFGSSGPGGVGTGSSSTTGVNWPSPDALPPGMNFGNATGVFAIGGPFSTPGAGPQFSSTGVPGWVSMYSGPAGLTMGLGISASLGGTTGGYMPVGIGGRQEGLVGAQMQGDGSGDEGAAKMAKFAARAGMDPQAYLDAMDAEATAYRDYLSAQPTYISGWAWQHNVSAGQNVGNLGKSKGGYWYPIYSPGTGSNMAMPAYVGHAGMTVGSSSSSSTTTGKPPITGGPSGILTPSNPPSWTSSDPALIGPTTGALLFDDLKKHNGGGIDERVVIAQIGEFMMQRRAAQHYGPEVMHNINNMRIPIEHLRYHAGGEVDDFGLGPPLLDTSFYTDQKSGTGPKRQPPVIVNVHMYDEKHAAVSAYLNDSQGVKKLMQVVRRNR